MNRVFVTGATGFIGRHAVRTLLAAGYEVHAVSPQAVEYPEGAHAHVIDLLHAAERRKTLALVQPTHMLHLAWHVPPGAFWTAMENVQWLQVSLDLLHEFAQCGGRRWVAAGTCAEYDWSKGGIYRESDVCLPATLYGACKNSLQVLASHMGPQLNVETAWGRIFYPYGPGEPEQRLVSSIIRALLAGKSAPCTEGSQVRDFIFVEDVANAFVTLLSSRHVGPVNIASGEPVLVREVAAQIGQLIGRPELLEFGKISARDFEPLTLTADITLLKSLGFHPSHSMAEGLQKTIESHLPS